jgi:putative transposase
MPTKKYKPEQIVSLLRQIEVAVANGKATPQACRDTGITDQSYYRWRFAPPNLDSSISITKS